MSDTHEVISAFLDDQPFDPQELDEALSDPAGRSLLIDLMALRRIVQPDDAIAVMRVATRTWRSPLRAAMAAAAIFVALVGGYFVGENRAATTSPEAPPPTRIVEAATTWQVIPEGGTR